MLSGSTLRHLRFKQSLFLSPVILFALVGNDQVALKTWGLYAILIGLIFPASNGYNSFYDRDEGSIGGLEYPPNVTKDLLFWSLGLETLALGLVFFLEGWKIVGLLFFYGVVSKLYSHPSTRWKANPWLSTLSVCLFQGALIFYVMKLSLEQDLGGNNIYGGLASTLLIAAAYPLTQIYQHQEDQRRGDLTLSRFLGIQSTFLFSMGFFILSGGPLFLYFRDPLTLMILFVCNVPAMIFLIQWMRRTNINPSLANFRNAHTFLGRLTLGSHLGVGILLFALSCSARADLVGTSQEPWFTMIVKENGSRTNTEFIDLKGKTLSLEVVQMLERKLLRYDWSQRQSGDRFFLGRSGEYWQAEYNNKKKSFSMKEYPDLLVPPMIAPEMIARIKKNPILKEWEFELLIPDKLMIISFKFQKTNMTWNLTPKNFFVRAVVGTIPFAFNSEGKLLEIKNFTPPVRFERNENSWETKKTTVLFH